MSIRLNQLFLKTLFCLIIVILLSLPFYAQNSQERLNEAQIKNQDAQANYYNKQAENSGSLLISYSAPITTIVGILIAVLTITLQNRNARKLEEAKWEKTRNDEFEKWNRTREDDLAKWQRLQDDERNKWKQAKKDEISNEARLAAADLMKKIAIAMQSMTWVAWSAKCDLEHFTYTLVVEHDDLMKTLYSDIVAAQVLLASYDKSLFEKTRKTVTLTYSYDARFALAAKDIDESDRKKDFEKYKTNVERLGKLWDELYKFSRDLPNQFANMLDIKTDVETNN